MRSVDVVNETTDGRFALYSNRWPATAFRKDVTAAALYAVEKLQNVYN